MKTYSEKLLFEEIKYHLPNLDLNKKIEIRNVKVLKFKRKEFILKNPKLNLFLLSNEWIEPAENHLYFYTVSTNQTKRIIGIEYLYFENGTKSESLFLDVKSNTIINILLKSKYNVTAKIN